MKNVPWPQDCIVASLRRGPAVLIPHGNTILQAGDVLVIVAEGLSLDSIESLAKDGPQNALAEKKAE